MNQIVRIGQTALPNGNMMAGASVPSVQGDFKLSLIEAPVEVNLVEVQDFAFTVKVESGKMRPVMAKVTLAQAVKVGEHLTAFSEVASNRVVIPRGGKEVTLVQCRNNEPWEGDQAYTVLYKITVDYINPVISAPSSETVEVYMVATEPYTDCQGVPMVVPAWNTPGDPGAI